MSNWNCSRRSGRGSRRRAPVVNFVDYEVAKERGPTIVKRLKGEGSVMPPVTAEAEIQLNIGPGGQAQHEDLFSKATAAIAMSGGGGGGDGGAPPGTSKPAAAPLKSAGSLAVTLLLALLGGLLAKRRRDRVA